MTQIDPEQERARLADVYSHHTDEELEQIAGDASELTELAQEELRAELTKRGLYVGQLEPDSPTGADDLEFRDLVTVRSFWNLIEAELAKGALDAAGIESFLFDDNMIRMDWFNANAIGGVKLRVDPQNAESAGRILDECAKAAGNAESEAADSDDPGSPS